MHHASRFALAALLACTVLTPACAAAQQSPVFRAMELEDAGQWEEAAALYRSALRTREGVDAAFGLERALITLGRAGELAGVMEALVRDVPDQPLFRAIYVRTLLAAEQVDVARAFVRHWISARPLEPEAYRQLYTTGPITAAEASAIWQRVRRAEKSDSAALIADELSEVVLAQGLWPAAREILEERYVRDRDAGIAEQLALVAVRAGEVERARAVAREAGLGESSTAVAWLALYDGDLVTARRLLRRADEADPSAVLPLAALSRTSQTRSVEFGAGVLALVRGDTARAARAFTRAAPELTGAEPLLLAWAARLHSARGEDAAAQRLYDLIVRDHPDSPEAPEAILAQGRARAAAGERDAAVERFEHLILAYPRSALVPAARRELDALRSAARGG